MKMIKHFTTAPLIEGLRIALLGSVWLYGAWWGLDFRLLNTITGLLFVYRLLRAERMGWFWSGFFIALFWFWWILVSFRYYHMSWAIPIGAASIALIYGGIFYSISWAAAHLAKKLCSRKPHDIRVCCTQYTVPLKALGFLGIPYLHPLAFDWFKPELVFVHSSLGVATWQFAIILLGIVLAQTRRNLLYLGIVVLAYSPVHTRVLPADPTHTIRLVATHTTMADKWNPAFMPLHIRHALQRIDAAIKNGYRVVVLPESIFPFFLNRRPKLMGELLRRSHAITIVIGALYYDHGVHRNATYRFRNGRYRIANKVLLVPFGEANPLPQWAGKWVNKIFFDGSIDYIASATPTDWEIGDQRYRNAICYEATSERLYAGKPERMIVLSNNGWFVPSVEPTFQRLLLEYYVRKYGTTIYHATNMSPAYVLEATF